VHSNEYAEAGFRAHSNPVGNNEHVVLMWLDLPAYSRKIRISSSELRMAISDPILLPH
jgi:hypothetical protein